MPANGRADRKVRRKVPQKIYRLEAGRLRPAGLRVRVKWCGKSAPRLEQFSRQGKPHAEQDQIGEEERPAPFDSRVGR